MIRKRLSVVLGMTVAVIAMSGCSKPKSEGEAMPGAAADAKPAMLAGSGPMQKPGLWEMTTQVEGMPKGLVSQLCIDEGLSTRMAEVGTRSLGKSDCTRNNVVKSGNTVDVDSVCTAMNRKITSHIHMEAAGDSAFTQTINSTMEPPLSGDGKSTTTVTGKRIGDCPADMKGGDMIMPGGAKVNLYDALNQAAATSR